MSRVALIPAAGYDVVRDAVNAAFRRFTVALRGRRVLVKPNVLRASEAGEGIVTHPALLEAVVDKVLSAKPADLVVGDNPGLFSYGANEAAFEQAGLMAAARGHYRNIGTDSRRVPFDPRFMPEVGVSAAVLDADVVISLPKFKTHGLTVLTGALKNSYGILPGAQKARLHRLAGSPAAFHQLLVEVFRLRPPDLFIMDAVVGMEGNGPASPDLRDVGLVIASDNGVAMDAVVAALMGLDPGGLPFLRYAKALGMGEYDLDRIDVEGDLTPIPNWRLPPLGGRAIQENASIQELMTRRTAIRPAADPELCTACGTCIDHCPVEALSMSEGLPVVAPEVCITCFCCQEICPEKAIVLR